MLTLEIEYLTGVCFAAESQASVQPDWPPQPDRVFSALVAAWGARGERPEEKAALEWLEQQTELELEATDAEPRRIGVAYVPPNDAKGKIEVLPERRGKQPRFFPAAIPQQPVVKLSWPAAAPDGPTLDALEALARDTAYVGHSASVVRCRFLPLEQSAIQANRPVRRRVYAGRTEELVREYRAGRRPAPGLVVQATAPATVEEPARGVFGSDWILFEDNEGALPDLRAFALVARRLRDALMSHYGEGVPEWLSGHQADGSATQKPHLAAVPLADVGFQHSEGRLLGLALVLPRELETERAQAQHVWLEGGRPGPEWRRFENAIASVSDLKLGKDGVWGIRMTKTPAKRSQQPGRYLRTARRWASVTPVVLDRFPKAKTAAGLEEETCEILAAACVNAGLPEPLRVRPSKHAAVKGAPASYPSGNAPEWTGWRLPGAMGKRLLTHVVLEFAEPVAGPVLIGAGRFAGLGLCLPQATEKADDGE